MTGQKNRWREMNHFAKARNELVEIIKGAYEALYNKNLPEEARIVVRGSIGSSIDHFRKGEIKIAKSDIQNLSVYGIK